jgi:multicomponent Na+:H+ antiporter subunit B
MKHSLILRTATRFLEPLLLTFAVFVLLVGHNEPGGGFAGGLIASAAFALHALVFGVGSARKALWISPPALLAVGLLTAVGSGLPALLSGKAYLTGIWAKSGGLYVGTPLIFDVGVFFTVVGVVALILFALAEE